MAKEKPDLAIAFGMGKPEEGAGYDAGGDDDEEYEACEEFLEHAGIMVPKEKRKAACEALCDLIRIVIMREKENESEGEGEGEEPSKPDLGDDEEGK